MGHGIVQTEFVRFFRSVIPEPQNREPLTFAHLPYFAVGYLPFLYLAYLARRPNTYVLRLLLLPIVVPLNLSIAFRYYWPIPSLNVYNWGQCLFAEVTVGKALEYALTPAGMLKIGEVQPGVVEHVNGNGVANGKSNGAANGHSHPKHSVSSSTSQNSCLPRWFADALELVFTCRGFQFRFGRGVHIPKQTRPLARDPFLLATLISFLRNFLLLDFLESVIKLFPGVGDVSGGSMFYSNLPPIQRYAVSTLIHMLTGSALLAGFGMCYDLITLIAVGLFNDTPTSWPPVTDSPWSSESMHECWAKRWHQLLRQTFIVFGGYPGNWIAGPFGAVLGTFIASGLYHEIATYAMGKGFDIHPPLFFSMQAIILALERVWRMVTGRKVGGWYGRLWVYFVMFVLGQPMVDSWHRRGLGGGCVIPVIFSPSKYILPPLVTSITTWLLPPRN
ncbi:hypothetical protein Moror_12498 [Moniliophthora roreri MCA 2997]|uniref:Wax synthase domain-containing protein n=2 Tax=Moniliophthora roreri TaxID=221103 RepID=V2YVQ7_MONRO|nr:hypothetical protein Moror_12498 [Moniliophthora roreri MCA 2997]KAI3616132.1 hypothetical protein WG66_014089 [Moniliophthora roreri]